MARTPWEWLYERQAQPLKTYVLDEIAALLARVVEEFPPDIEDWESLEGRARFEPLLKRHHERPEPAVVRVALRLYRWELERDVGAIDEYMRHERWQERGLNADQLELAIFLWRYWLEQTLSFKEYAGDKFRWSELTGLADRLERRLVEEESPLRQ